MQRHPAEGVRRAAQARVERPDARLQAVQGPLGDRDSLDEMTRDLAHGPVHREVVLARGDDQVDAREQPVPVHPIVMEQRPPGRLVLKQA